MLHQNRRAQSLLVFHGGLIFLVGVLVGVPYWIVVSGRLHLWPLPIDVALELPGDVRAWRMAHLEGLLNGMAVLLVAAVLPCVVLKPLAVRLLTWGVAVGAWGNTVASVLGAIFGGRGLFFGDIGAGNVMYLLFVVAAFAVVGALGLVVWGAFQAWRTLADDP